MWSGTDLNLQHLFSSARRQPIVWISVCQAIPVEYNASTSRYWTYGSGRTISSISLTQMFSTCFTTTRKFPRVWFSTSGFGTGYSSRILLSASARTRSLLRWAITCIDVIKVRDDLPGF